ncbi:MAG: ferrous iron transport protein A [Oscillospiraceae bacterium]|jgi:ferrous iron transport protein A|nr:ferrous iron transport protein A [Oscillospiraceae bacterium]
MPLTLAKAGEQNIIKKVGGPPDTRQFLEKLGFVPGSTVTVVAATGGNVIVSIRQSRIAISREMANKILV